MLKIGIVSNPDRVAVFKKSLARFDAEVVAETSIAPDWRQVLISWDSLNFDICIIDDAPVADKAAMQSAIRYFQAMPRPTTAHMRLIFFASEEASPQDPFFTTLATDGVYDMVLPFRDNSALGKLCELVEYPAKRNDVLTLIAARAPVVMTDPKLTPPSSNKPLTKVEQARFLARGQSVIAVAGIMPRAGASLAAIALARTLVMLDQIPALVIASESYEAYQSCYPSAMSKDGKSYLINGVTIFCGSSPSVVARRYTHVVLDLGYIGWGSEATTVEAQQAVIEFGKADLQVVYITCTNPIERSWLKRFILSQHPSDINRYALAIWGTTTELFDNLKTSIIEKSPDAYVWQMPPLLWPLALSKTDEGIAGALEPVLPRDAKLKSENEEPSKDKSGGIRLPWIRRD